MFYKDYNLLIYLKSALAAPSRIKEVESQDSLDSSKNNSKDNLLDIKDFIGF